MRVTSYVDGKKVVVEVGDNLGGLIGLLMELQPRTLVLLEGEIEGIQFPKELVLVEEALDRANFYYFPPERR